jgi:hypothetical protein
MTGASTTSMLGAEGVDQLPIEEGKEGPIVLHQRVILHKGGEGLLVIAMRRRYHERELLSERAFDKYAGKEYLLSRTRSQRFIWKY